ncbi:MAG: glutamate--tRNA ligase [Tissierellia bacterium]|nr:glutamate--tRNA ligase [Tissierellia bacterium]
MTVRVRFAPSPTGWLHIGGLRTALFNYLYARKHGGSFILRIEDTDRTRYVEGAIENLIEALHWSGLDFDEGPKIIDGALQQVGDRGPYIQSERLELYKKYVDQLIASGHAYYCFCTKERLDDIRKEREVKGLVPKYDGFCRSVPQEEAKKRIEAGEPYVVRMKLPAGEDITFQDLVRGKITINTDDMDDQVLLKSDGFPTYHMAVVVDDHLMGVTHIVRGEEWLPSTPKHVYLYQALGWEKPTYVHLPTVLNKDRKKLSKRQGDVSVEDFKSAGYLPEALVNYLALLGWSPDKEDEFMTLEEMVELFDFDRVSKTGGIFDVEKLNWVNAHYIRHLENGELLDRAKPFMVEALGYSMEEIEERREYYEIMMEAFKENAATLKVLADKCKLFSPGPVTYEEDTKEWLESEDLPTLKEAIIELLDEGDMTLERAGTFMKELKEKTGIKGKNLFMPVRSLLTGAAHGPEFHHVLYLLGKDEILRRVKG